MWAVYRVQGSWNPKLWEKIKEFNTPEEARAYITSGGFPSDYVYAWETEWLRDNVGALFREDANSRKEET